MHKANITGISIQTHKKNRIIYNDRYVMIIIIIVHVPASLAGSAGHTEATKYTSPFARKHSVRCEEYANVEYSLLLYISSIQFFK